MSVTTLGLSSGILFSQEKSTANAAALAIDAGSSTAYIDQNVQSFAPDLTQPQVASIDAVAGTNDDPLYYLFDSGTTLNYSYAVPNGKYTLKLFFFDPNSTAVGQQTFNVAANGATVLKHFDIFAAAGATSTAVTTSLPLTISNKKLALEFKAVVGEASVSAFELVPT